MKKIYNVEEAIEMSYQDGHITRDDISRGRLSTPVLASIVENINFISSSKDDGHTIILKADRKSYTLVWRYYKNFCQKKKADKKLLKSEASLIDSESLFKEDDERDDEKTLESFVEAIDVDMTDASSQDGSVLTKNMDGRFNFSNEYLSETIKSIFKEKLQKRKELNACMDKVNAAVSVSTNRILKLAKTLLNEDEMKEQKIIPDNRVLRERVYHYNIFDTKFDFVVETNISIPYKELLKWRLREEYKKFNSTCALCYQKMHVTNKGRILAYAYCCVRGCARYRLAGCVNGQITVHRNKDISHEKDESIVAMVRGYEGALRR